MLIDTHTHLYIDAFDADRDQAMQRAMQAGVSHFLLPAIAASYYDQMHALQKAYPKAVHLMAGLHPTSVKENTCKQELEAVNTQLSRNTVIAIGEIGIDLYWDTSTLALQKEVFATQIAWAKAKQLPIVIHCRNAFDEVFEVLEPFADSNLKGVFHCFTGTLQQAKKALDLNLYLGIGGVVTFKNGKIDSFLNQIPLERILLETDAPYLAPVPYRGKRNESSYLVHVLSKVAACYNKPEAHIAEITTANAKTLFKIP